MAQSSTRRKTCLLGNICILCAFSFVSIETIDGKENICKFYEVKLKLSKDRIECIWKVTETHLKSYNTCNADVRKKCFRIVESILKTEKKNNATMEKIKQSLNQVFRNQIFSLSCPRLRHITTTGKLTGPNPPGPVSRQAKSSSQWHTSPLLN